MPNPSISRWVKHSSFIAFSLAVSAISQVFSQETQHEGPGSWMVVAPDNQISERLSIPLVGILCYENVTEVTAFGFIRTGVAHRPDPKLRLTLGGAYMDSQPLYHNDPGTLSTQLWIYEEGALTIGKGFNHRFRLEH